MIYLVSGGSGSGKSACAEEMAVLAGGAELVYIATMEVIGEEGKRKVCRHQRLRAGKGFVTVECPRNLQEINLGGCGEERVILLECILNLAANELFGEDIKKAEERGNDTPKGKEETVESAVLKRAKKAAERMKEGIRNLEEQCRLLVIVSGDVFSDGVDYGEETNAYLALLGEMNCWIGARASKVVEVVCGIPVRLKGMGMEV